MSVSNRGREQVSRHTGRAETNRSGRAGLHIAALASVVAAGLACGDDGAGQSATLGLNETARGFASDGSEFRDPEEYAAEYWTRPVPPQGPPPPGASALEASLQPADCGTCHPQQYEDWRTTLHSGAYSPGLAGQLVNWEAGSFATVAGCLVCHAPLSEQSARIAGVNDDLEPNPDFDATLRDHGLVCAACHVRGWRRYGPPRRDGTTGPSPPGSPHGGSTRTPFFEDARFCSGCHQFPPGSAAPNGKPLENTYNEWRDSRYSREGISCQGCHMPDRRHLWRGIHDPEMVKSGVTIEWTWGESPEATEVGLRLINSGTGHRFPTYVTPEVHVRLQLLDGEHQLISGGSSHLTIARQVESRGGRWIETSDTRLPPDSAATLKLEAGDGASWVRGTVEVRPDAFYRGVFASLLRGTVSDTSRSLLEEAHRRTLASPFVIFDETVPVAQR